MQTTRYWQVLLQDKIPDIYEYLIKADKDRNINYENSATNLRKFLEAIVGMMLKYENIIENETQIKKLGLANGIIKLQSQQAIDKSFKIKLDKIREIGNEGAHPFTDIKKYELDEIFNLTKEVAEYFMDNYTDKIINEENRMVKEVELPELQENEIYIFECLKPECRREIKEKNNLKICKKCGGPVKFKNIDANYISCKTEPIVPYPRVPTFRPKSPEPVIVSDNSTIAKKHKIEIYDNSLELIKEVVLNKENILVGRSSASSEYMPDIDLVDIANDENGNCLISRQHVQITKIEDDYYVRNASSKSLVKINHQNLEYNKSIAKLINNDVIILNNFIALVYRVV